MTQRYVLIRHGDEPGDDRAETFLRGQGAAVQVVRPFRGEALPGMDGSVAGTVIYGGPFAAYEEDRHPFLLDEARWIEAALVADLPMLGICQGAQQIARVLGAHVGPRADGACEFGLYTVEPTEAGRDILPAPIRLTQSHFHGFDLPQGAELLAQGETFPQQAFRFGRAYAFQFHAEVTPAGFRRWQEADWAYYDKPGAQSRAQQDRLMAECDAAQHAWFTGFMARQFGVAG